MKFIKIFFILFLFINLLSFESYADDSIDDELQYLDTINTSSNIDNISLSSKYALVLERSTNSVLFEKNGYTKTPMASTTKIMTAIIALENSNINDNVQISSKAAHIGGSTLGIYSNTIMSMESLLYGLLLRSGNDCAVAIAEHIGGNLENFAKLMNEKAKTLGLNSTNFVTPHGLDKDNHYTTAYDLAILTNYALQNKIFSKIVSTKSCSIYIGKDLRTISNTNELLGFIEGIYGVKTGFTGNAGRCLVSACKRGNLDIIVVVLGAGIKKQRTVDSINLINYIYKNFEIYDFKEKINEIYLKFLSEYSKNINISKSISIPEFYLSEPKSFLFPIQKIDSEKINCSIYTLKDLEAPLKKHSKIGVLQAFSNNELIFNLDIYLSNNLEKTSIKEYFFKLFKQFSTS